MQSTSELANILSKKLGLSSYESQAYSALIVHGAMSPTELSRKTHIPRPRTYDVLSRLTAKGLLKEQVGKPPIYMPIEPESGLENLVQTVKRDMLIELEGKKDAAKKLASTLSDLYKKSKYIQSKEYRVWLTRRDAAFISTYCKALEKSEKEVVVATDSQYPPERKILKCVKQLLKKNVTLRVVRQITDSWDLKDLARYEQVLKAGSQVRLLDTSKIPLRFTVFDEKETIIVLPTYNEASAQEVEALWLKIHPLARILHIHFEELWKEGKPIVSLLEKIKAGKERTTRM